MCRPNPGATVLSNEQSVRVPLRPARHSPQFAASAAGRAGISATGLWRIRGLIDLMTGGVGMRRGRPDPETPLPGSTLDFWRVQIYEPGRRLRLFAEMRVPGRAWLEFRAEPDGPIHGAQADRAVRAARVLGVCCIGICSGPFTK